jgi:hypothetical protein
MTVQDQPGGQAEGQGGVLAAVVGMVHRPGVGAAVTHRHVQSLDDQCRRGSLAHGPPDHLAGEGVDDDGQVESALTRGMLCHVPDPQDVRGGYGELAVHEVRDQLVIGVATSTATVSAAVDAHQASLAHQPGDPLLRARHAQVLEFGMDAGRPIGASAGVVDHPDQGQELVVPLGPG